LNFWIQKQWITKTRPFKVYTSTPTNISNKNNEGFDDTTNGQEKWGEGGATTQLMNTIVTLQKLEILDVDEHEKSNVRYYVEEFYSLGTIDANG